MAWIHRRLSARLESREFQNTNSTAVRRSSSRQRSACNSRPLSVIPVVTAREHEYDLINHSRWRSLVCCFTFSNVALQLQSSINISPTWTAFSAVMWLQGAFNVPDSRIPRDTKPRVTGDSRCKLTLPPPWKKNNRKLVSVKFVFTLPEMFVYLHSRLQC